MGRNDARAGARAATRRACTALLALASVLVPTLATPAAAADPPTFTVNTVADVASADCVSTPACSLRGAVAAANASTDALVIVPAGRYVLVAGDGDLDVQSSMTLRGVGRMPGTGATTIDGNGTDRVLDVAAGHLRVEGVELTNGRTNEDGGALRVAAGGTATVVDGAVHANRAMRGGAIQAAGALSVSRSALYGNIADQRGGAINASGPLTVVNTTISDNAGSGGAGISSSGGATVTHATVTANRASGEGGGGVQRSGGDVTITASIVFGNTGAQGPDCIGSPTFAGVNILGSRSGCRPGGGSLRSDDPRLGPLADNGGASPTHALGEGSPAIDAVTPCVAGVATDQRGQPRPTSGCDVGAYEIVPLSVSLAFGPDGASVGAGAATVPLDSLVARAAAEATTETVPSTPFGAIPFGAIPFGAIPFGAIPFGAIPFGAIPFGAIPFGAIPFGAILLSDVPLDHDGGWSALLAGTEFADDPIETVTLADVLSIDAVRALPFGAIDLSGTPFGAIPFGAIALGTVPLGAIPLGAIGALPTEGDRIAAWCDLLGADTCEALGIDVGTDMTLVGLALAGVPFGAIPFGAIPLGAIELSGVPFGAIPFGAIPFGAIALDATPFGAIPLGAIDFTGIVDCAGACPATFGETQASGELVETATIAQLYLQNGPSAWLDDITVGQVLLAALDPGDLPWDELDLTGVQLQDLAEPSQAPATFTATVDLFGSTADVTLDVVLPDGFRPVGSSSRLDGAALADPTPVAGGALRFTVSGLEPGRHTITLDAWAGLVLGRADASATVEATTPIDTATDSDGAHVTVVEAFDDDDAAAAARALTSDDLHLAHVSTGGDLDWYQFDVGATGARASILLSNLAVDHDLVLFGPRPDPLRGPPLQHLTSVADGVLGLDALGASLAPETLPDVPLTPPDGGYVAYRVSANRGTADERLETGTLVAGRYYVQVSGYNGARSDKPYALRLRRIGDQSTSGPCPPRVPYRSAPAPLGEPPGLAGVETLFLVNSQRLATQFESSSARAEILGALQDPRWGSAAVIPVDADSAVRAAYAAWDADRCSIDAANDVVRAVGDVVDTALARNAADSGGVSTVDHVVLVGADDQIPMARVPDGTLVANERSYGSTFASGNELHAALAGGHLLTDNPYGAARSVGVDGHELFVPDVALGRLVESPADIVTALDNFLDVGGVLDPATALVTGYDFLTDGANEVRDALADAGLTVDDSLISDVWTAQDLADALAGNDVASINAHFDHFRALPGLGNATHDETEPYTVADVVGPLTRALLFSMGCHSGLSASDVSLGTATPDWAATFARAGALWAGNTGYGYGDTEIVALSESLMASFARRLATGTTVGEAMTAAKQEYYGGLPALTPYDEKVVQEVVLYGLPMYRLPGATGAALQGVTTSAAPTSSVHVQLTRSGAGGASDADHLHEVVTDRGRYYEVDGETLAVQHRPLQPKVVVALETGGQVAHGALVTSLESIDLGAFDPVYFRPTVDLAAREPERQVGEAPFPAAIQRIAGDRLVLVPGQFRDVVPETGIGTQRLFTDIGVEVLYAPPGVTDFRAPSILQSSATVSGATATIEVQTDGTATRVVAMAKRLSDVTTSSWTLIELQHLGGGAWTGAAPQPAGGLEFFVQAADGAGNVSVSSAKTDNFLTAAASSAGEVDIVLTGGTVVDGWYTGQVTVQMVATPQAPIYQSVDGSPFEAYDGPFTLDAAGSHVVEARTSAGASDAVVFRLDATGPTTAATATPAEPATGWYTGAGAARVDLSADDGIGSGVASITVTSPSTSTSPGDAASVTVTQEGITSVSAYATDVVGNAGPAVTRTVKIDRSAPLVSCAPAPTTWSRTDVNVACAVSDTGSGVTTGTVTLSATALAGTATSNASTNSVEVCDVAGNCATAGPVTGVKIDKQAPLVTIRSPAGTIVQGATVLADYECTDGEGSGVAGCAGAVADGASVPTGTAGAFSFAVTGTDAAGNEATASSPYTVVAPAYHICLLYNEAKAGKVGSAFPVKLQLCDAARQNLSAASIVLTGINVDGSLALRPNFAGSSNAGYEFRYDPSLAGYIYNLDTTGYPSGRHEMWFSVSTDPGVVYKAPFRLQ